MRPRKATCGDDARRMSSTIEMTAPTSTPLSKPAQSTPSERGHGDEEFAAMQLPEPLEHFHFHEARDGHEHDRGEHRLRQVAQQVGEKERDDEDDARGDQARERRARAAAFVDERLRHAAADREALADAGGEIRAGEGEQFLVAVEPVAVLLGKHPSDRRRLDRAEEEARERQRHQLAHFGLMHVGQRRHRQRRAALRRAASRRARRDR